MNFSVESVNRFYDKVSFQTNGCLEWSGSINNKGYGEIRINCKKFFAHRASWIIHNGPIPNHHDYHGLCVLHKCDNRKCVNPEHLFLGTNYENILDMHKKKRRKYTRKLEYEYQNIRDLYNNGWTQKKISENYGTSKNLIFRVVNGRIK